MKTNNRGVASVVVVAAVAVIGLFALLPNWKLPAFLQKQPPTAKLQQAEDDLAKARAAQAAAEAQLAATRAQQQAQTNEQIRYAQQSAVGAADALTRVPPSHATPEVKLALQLIGRTNSGLAAAIGALPETQREEILRIVAQALSEKDEEVAKANARLAEMDAQLRVTSAAKLELEKKIPTLETAANTARAEAAAKDAEVQAKTHEVTVWAEKKADADRRAGSLDAYAGNLVRVLIAIGLGYVLVHFILPSLAQEFPASRLLGVANKAIKSITSAHL